MNSSYKSNNNKKAFTLIELLIVIAIIGILFIVLVSKVDFATDKAKATGVQTDFRSFQLALDQVAKENAGFNAFGWDTGDDNGDRIRNSYDRGDTNKNGKEDAGETFIGRKTYGETWTSVYTLLNPKEGMEDDTSAFVALEQAINANLDPKLHITITPDVEGGNLTGNATITMANQAHDPWKNEYHGVFITNAERDNGTDRGAIIMYSNGANGVWGSEHSVANGVVNITVPGNNVAGQDDYAMVSCYTYVNGYGEVLNMTTGFSSNQNFLSNGGSTNAPIGGSNGSNINNPQDYYECGCLKSGNESHDLLACGHYECRNCGCVAASCGQNGHWSGDGRDHSLLSVPHHDYMTTFETHRYACQCITWTVPDSCTYQTIDGLVFNAGDVIPCAFRKQEGDVLIDTEYKYTYSDVMGGAAWKVVVLDTTKTSYKPILDYIAGQHVTYMDSTYRGCSNLIVAPEIPDCVTVLRCAFYQCPSLTTAPVIPANVSNLVMTFQDCPSLTGTITIKTNLITDNYVYSNDPRGYSSHCFAYTKLPIVLVGTGENDSVLELLSGTNVLYNNITY